MLLDKSLKMWYNITCIEIGGNRWKIYLLLRKEQMRNKKG